MIKGGPRIVTDGLVLCLDAHDAKSYAGEPVTNLYGDMSTSSSLRGNRTEYNTGGTWPSDMPMCPEPVGRVYKHTSGALTSSWSGNSYGYMHKDISTTSGLMYTLTCWVYLSPDCDIDYMFASIEGATSNYGAWPGYSNGYDLTKKGTWQLLSRHATADTSVRFLIYPGHTGVTDGSFSGFFAWGGMQVVQAEHVTPFVLSSRSATNGWVDRSGNSNSGTLTNMIGTDASHYRDGQVIMPVANSYLDFDGTNDYINLPHSELWQNISQISYDLWFNPDVVNVRQGLISSHAQVSGANNDAIEIEIQSSGSSFVGFRSTNGTFYSALYSTSLSANTWYNLTGVLSSSDIKYYLNGQLVATQSSWPGGNVANSASQTLMLARYDTHYFNGKIGLFRAYNKALTAAEVLSNYNATKGRFS